MSGMTLYSLQGRLYELIEKAESEELTEQEAAEQYEQLCVLIQQKSAGIIGYYRNLESGISAVDAEIKRLQEIKDRATKARDKFKEYVKGAMESMGFAEIGTEIGKLKISKNPASVEILDAEQVPEMFKTTETIVTTKIDKMAIKKHFSETGEIISGVNMVVDKTRLDIK